jgi:hypothetical protein
MAPSYSRRVLERAFKETRHVLRIETGGRALITLLLATLSLACIWLVGGKEMATQELVIRAALTIAVLVSFPVVYLVELIATPAKMAAEQEARIASVNQELSALKNTRASLIFAGIRKNGDYGGWRLLVRNEGSAAAIGTKVKLESIEPPICEVEHHEYLLRFGVSEDAPPSRILKDESAPFLIIASSQVHEDDATVTFCGAENNFAVMKKEVIYTLIYKISAENADSISVILCMKANDHALIIAQMVGLTA